MGRLWLYALPWEVVLHQLPNTLLVAMGLTEIVSPVLLVGSIYALLALLTRELRTSVSVPSTLERRPAWALRGLPSGPSGLDWEALGKTAVFVGIGLAVLFGWRNIGAALAWDWQGMIVAAATAALGALISAVIFAAIRASAKDWGYYRSLFLTATLVAVAFVPLFYWNAMTLPLPYAVACGAKTQTGGWLIGETDSRLILGTTDDNRSKRHILIASSSGLTVVETDHPPPLPSCPS